MGVLLAWWLGHIGAHYSYFLVICFVLWKVCSLIYGSFKRLTLLPQVDLRKKQKQKLYEKRRLITREKMKQVSTPHLKHSGF